MDALLIGGGNAAQRRLERWDYPADVTGVVDIDPDCWYAEAYGDDDLYTDLDTAAAACTPDAVDICVPTTDHYSVAERVDARFPDDTDIIIEKPVATAEELAAFEALAEKSEKAFVVDEQYRASAVTEAVQEHAAAYGLDTGPVDITVDFTKNRKQDIVDGRYLDEELGVFGYEAPHMLMCAAMTGDDRMPETVEAVSVEAMEIEQDGERTTYPLQGAGELAYRTGDGSRVSLHTAMTGDIAHPVDPFDTPDDIPYGDETRWRVIEVTPLDDSEPRILGRYEPDHTQDGYGRGRVAVVADGTVTVHETVPDRNMEQLLTQAYDYFRGVRGTNPSPVDAAADIVRFLDHVADAM